MSVLAQKPKYGRDRYGTVRERQNMFQGERGGEGG